MAAIKWPDLSIVTERSEPDHFIAIRIEFSVTGYLWNYHKRLGFVCW